MMAGERYNEYLVEMVKAAGKDITENAEALVGDMKLRTDFTIQLTFEQNGTPMIEVLTSYISKKCLDRHRELMDGGAVDPNKPERKSE